MPTTPPTADELRTLVATQLRQYGVDISVLPAGGPGEPTSDPATGQPTQYALIGNVVALMQGSVSFIAGYDTDADYRQRVQEDVPVEYPSPFSAWTR